MDRRARWASSGWWSTSTTGCKETSSGSNIADSRERVCGLDDVRIPESLLDTDNAVTENIPNLY